MMARKSNLFNLMILVSIIVMASIVKSQNVRVEENCQCGRANIVSGRIINGEVVDPHRFPWQAALYIPDDYLFCGGAVISSKNVLTAAHCIYDFKTDVFCMLGMHKQGQGIRFNVTAFSLHPKFTSGIYYDDYDMAIVAVDRKIEFSHIIRPICLPSVDIKLGMKMATVTGWGRILKNLPYTSTMLRATKVKIIPNIICSKLSLFDKNKFNFESMICAYTAGTDSCQGDSGGPLFIEVEPNRHVIVGIVSFGAGCAHSAGIYSRIATETTLRWINDAIVWSEGTVCSN